MKRTFLFGALALSGSSLFAAGGCTTATRNVTHMSGWSGDAGDYFYLAYAEDAATSRIKLCHIHDDNTISCAEQPELDALLNPR